MAFQAPPNSISNEFDPRPFAESSGLMQQANYEYGPEASALRSLATLDKHAATMQSIMMASDKHEMEKEAFDLEKQQAELDLKKATIANDLSQTQVDMLKTIMSAHHKQREQVLGAKDVLLEQAKNESKKGIAEQLQVLASQGMAAPTTNMYNASTPSLPNNLNVKQPITLPSANGASVIGEEPETWQDKIQAMRDSGLDPEVLFKGSGIEVPKERNASLSVNALKVDDNDRQILNAAYQARNAGQEVSGDAVLSSLSPELAVGVKGLIDYNDDPVIYPTRNNARGEMIRIARMVDPTYDPTKYQERKKYRIELASESSIIGKQKVALNTVAQHVAQLDGYIDALGGGDLKPVNMVVNFAKEMTGNPNIATYEQAHEAVLSEMQRLLTGVGVTQEGMREARRIVDRNTGYAAKKAALQSLVKIIEGRVSPLRQAFKKKMGREESGEIVYPETNEIFNKYLSDVKTSDKFSSFRTKAKAAGYSDSEIEEYLKGKQ